MPHASLKKAAETLRTANVDANDPSLTEELESLTDRLEELANKQYKPDHGRLARLQEDIRNVQTKGTVGDDAIKRAYECINEFRETIEGV